MPQVETLELTDHYGKFILEPLSRGFGQTVGNALRRTLLSSIPGIAIRAVKIENVLHEFSPIQGVKEDATQLLLNLKDLSIKASPSFEGSLNETILRVEVKGIGKVTGADVQCPEGVEVVNPECYLASITEKGAFLKMDLYIGKGVRYCLPHRHEEFRGIIGTIPMGSQYTPVRKVAYFAEPTRIGTQTDSYERLILEVWTNGSVPPNDALTQSVQVLDGYFKLFYELGQPDHTFFKEEDVVEDQTLSNIPDLRVDDLHFSQRTCNCLRRANIVTLRQLAMVPENDLNNIRGFGRKSLHEVRDKLLEYDIHMRTSDDYRSRISEDEELENEGDI